ncbi:GGDEF domain-containing protein [Stomatohabitans albus]|uniref:GGDEF domain-containing protein n=1 Tax=Stomatohabitans albus TaxID=3110766 RepID=UPI00300D106B
MEQANWPSWLKVPLLSKPFAKESFDVPSIAVVAAMASVLTAFTWFGPTWASKTVIWICLFLTLESFGSLLHETEHKTTWFFAMACALLLPIWLTVAIQYGPQASLIINVLILAADVSAILTIASTTHRTLSAMITNTMPVLIMVSSITIAVILESGNPDALITIKWLHLVCLLLIGLTAYDASNYVHSIGPVSSIIMLTMSGYWFGTLFQALPTVSYLVEGLTWETASGRVITVLWLSFLTLSITAQREAISLSEFNRKKSGFNSAAASIGSVELAIWVLPLTAIMGMFSLSATSFRVLAVSAIIAAALFIRRFRVLQISEMETSDRLHVALATDPLTGALNRTGLAKHWDENHSGATVAFIDLDQFKPINDRHGHIVGDEVLQVLSRRIMNSIRCEDVVCRWGGDEFLIVGPIMDADDADTFCDRIRDAIQVPITVKGGLVLKMDASIGYALVNAGVDFVTATEQADRMMYLKKQKKQGRAPKSTTTRTRETARVNTTPLNPEPTVSERG